MLNIPFNDVDIITNGLYQEIKQFFICKKNNIEYGTFKIIFLKEKFEITTYRKEKLYLDYRNPRCVEFISDAKEDLKRRDFTINCFLMNEKLEIFDYVNGYNDLKKKFIRIVGDPFLKLTEDVLRMMRVFVLQAKTNFKIDYRIQQILISNVFLLENLNPNDIWKELKKITQQKFFKQAFLSLKDTNAINYVKEFKEGILFVLKEKLEVIYPELFLNLSFILNPNIINSFSFSKKEKKRMNSLFCLYKISKNKLLN
ncbi:tRNA nucleotidyltransferase/polyA polymerase [Candidatus Phytoplasma luffae]|uniref:tRNA nucleotidyltransferase/polyA polymerase n=1 Tax=Loofah witches'-broom phytoplasma TaxID=35773 RepID=A0A975ILS3_LOWBP|nr:tRNA nucleotidyltransferase/polyA polymerase [Candidatus Phytoplasma luffae]